MSGKYGYQHEVADIEMINSLPTPLDLTQKVEAS